MLFTPLLPEAASGTLEPRHVVVPLRMMCRHAELVVGRVTGLDTTRQGGDRGRNRRSGRDRLRAARARARLGLARPARSRSGRARTRLSRPRRRDRASQPCAPAARGRGRCGHAGGAGPASRVRLRRRRVRGRRGTRRARRPRAGRAAPLPRPQNGTAALGARRRGAEDPPRDPHPARRVRGGAARAPRRGDSRLDAARVGGRAGLAPLRRNADRHRDARLDRGRPSQPRPRRARACRWTTAVECPSTSVCGCGVSKVSGRSGTAPLCRMPRRPAGSTHRPRSMPSGRRGASHGTSPARRRPTATACSARRRRWVATRASPT